MSFLQLSLAQLQDDATQCVEAAVDLATLAPTGLVLAQVSDTFTSGQINKVQIRDSDNAATVNRPALDPHLKDGMGTRTMLIPIRRGHLATFLPRNDQSKAVSNISNGNLIQTLDKSSSRLALA